MRETSIFFASFFLRAMKAPLIKNKEGSPNGLLPIHSTIVPSIKPISCRRRRISAGEKRAVTVAFSPGFKSDK